MKALIEAQGAQTKVYEPGQRTFEVNASRAGIVTSIDNLHVARVARLAGAPLDKGAGVDLLKKLGDAVESGEALYRVHAQYPADYRFARDLTEDSSGYTIADEGPAAGGVWHRWATN
jgi:thymidine phosphorylase